MVNYLSIKKNITGFLILLFAIFTIYGCKKAFELDSPKSDSIAIYDELWSFMNTHYAMFSIKGVDWDKTYLQYKTQVKPNMTDAELFSVLNKMLLTLKDGHISLITKKDTSTYLNFYQDYPLNFNLEIIRNNYLNNDFKRVGPIIYKIFNNIGYLYYSSFSKDVSDSDLDILFKSLRNTKGLIIDVRGNTGGKAINADKLFGRLIAEKKLVKYEVIKKGTAHNDFFEPQPVYVTSYGETYTQLIALLTNRSCFSACNDFALYISLLPNAKLIGDQTGGGAGIPYNYILANGWKIQYSATYTLSPEKQHIENGIQPNLKISITPQDELEGKDPILETAFKSLSE